MSYEIEYSDCKSPETIQKALDDCKDWLGADQYARVSMILMQDKGQTSRNLLRVGLMMQGIQGYPAEAMINTYWTPQRELFGQA
jgi:hypothetical protein